MKLAELVVAGKPALMKKYGHKLTTHQRQALNAIVDCRTGALGSTLMRCEDCQREQYRHRSCGHRSCPQSDGRPVSITPMLPGWHDNRRDCYRSVTSWSPLRYLHNYDPWPMQTPKLSTTPCLISLSVPSTLLRTMTDDSMASPVPVPSCIPTVGNSTIIPMCISSCRVVP